jgi:hypothetical protein
MSSKKPMKSPTKKLNKPMVVTQATDSQALAGVSQALVMASTTAEPLSMGQLERWVAVNSITTQSEYVDLVTVRKHLKGLIKAAQEKYKPSIDKLNSVIKDLKVNRDLVAAPAERLDSHLKELMESYEAVQRQQLQAEAERRAATLAKRAPQVAAEIVAQAEIAIVTPEVQGVSYRHMRRARVVDMMALVKAVAAGKASIEVLEVNQSYLNALAKLPDATMPGVEFYTDSVSVIGSR